MAEHFGLIGINNPYEFLVKFISVPCLKVANKGMNSILYRAIYIRTSHRKTRINTDLNTNVRAQSPTGTPLRLKA